jgi:hypothetical protein
VKMRMTGHTQSEIEQILEQCAQAARETNEDRDWQKSLVGLLRLFSALGAIAGEGGFPES